MVCQVLAEVIFGVVSVVVNPLSLIPIFILLPVLEEEISNIVKEKPGLRANAYMGLVIAKLGAGVDKRRDQMGQTI